MKKVQLSVFRNDLEVDQYSFEALDGIEQSVLIGRAPECHILIEDHQISRHHIEMKYSNGILSVKNVSQYETIYVNGRNVSSALVSDNDSIDFFDYRIRIQGVDDSITENVINLTEKKSVEPEEVFSEDLFDEQVSENHNLTEDKTAKVEFEPSGNIENDNFNNEDLLSEAEETFILDNGSSDISVTPDEIENITKKIETLIDSSVDDNLSDDNFTDDVFDEPDLSEETNFSEESDSFIEDSSFEEKTKIITSFAKVFLYLSGKNIPFDKYLLPQGDTIIGSDVSKANVVLSGQDVFAKHVLICLDKKNIVIESCDPQKGIYVNGEKTNKSELLDGDEFLIGETSFVLKVGSYSLSDEEFRLMPVDSEEDLIEHVSDLGELDISSGSAPESSQGLKAKVSSFFADPKKKRMFYIVAIGAIALILLDDSGDSGNGQLKKKVTKTRVAPKESKEKLIESVKKEKSKEELEFLESHYILAQRKIDGGDYESALFELDLVAGTDASYKETSYLINLAKEGLIRLEEAERKRKEKQEELKIQEKIINLISKSKDAIKNRSLELARTYLDQVSELDPEDSSVVALRIEVESIEKEIEKKRIEKEKRQKARSLFLTKLAPIKKLHADSNWYEVIKNSEKLFKMKDVDKDLMDDLQTLYSESTNSLRDETNLLLEKARGYRQGEDLKNAYDVYKEILKKNPSSGEAINEISSIEKLLSGKAKKVFREALVSESISLYDDAKQKFLEVLQIAPTDSDYYQKAKAHLKEFYLE